MSKIKELELKEDPLDDSWEGGYETCKGKAVIIIKDLEKEIETLNIHLKYGLAGVTVVIVASLIFLSSVAYIAFKWF
jgi:hypothetical protein